MEEMPSYVSVTFILTTFLTIGLLFFGIKQSVPNSTASKIVVLAIGFWLFFTAILALGGFFLDTRGIPPRFAIAPLPAVFFIVFLFIFFRDSFIANLPLRTLTLLHIVRIPVEITLWWLYKNGQIPEIMTFEGMNFDIFAGLSAPLVFWLAFRNENINRPLLIGWNIICLLLVTNIVVIAIFSLPTIFQQFGMNQPNQAVLYFPYTWLPAIIVPIVIFAHLSSLFQAFNKHNQ